MSEDLIFHSPYENANSNLYNTIHCLEKDSCPYTEKNNQNEFLTDNENENFYEKNQFQDEFKFDESTAKNQDNFEDNPDVFLFQPPVSIQNLQEKISPENYCTNSGKTRATSLTLGKKRERQDIEKINAKIKSSEETTTKIKTNCGRKKKEDKEKGQHTQLSEDNIIRKLKSNYLKYNHNQINQSFKDQTLQFLKLDSEINENLKKDYNEKLMNTTIKELYETYPISSKYRKQKTDNSDLNKKIIYKLYSEENEEKKEHEVIRMLNSTYLESFENFREKNLYEFLNEIKSILEKNGESKEYIQEYSEKLEKLCKSYKDWFLSKSGRRREKKQK